ncbi:hypothetical protein PTSG_11569 [Salpingoeca rosetta]|uniref:J domain-containing protein n=1 Tax=Salpingoeca rosetta (strain ATCC 50818 / BSB-021) TaxID=946362 RepID=F2TW03_SALR5|nr:uncharacterized protein PTSG_11569 [Salpingoeca rosetta]EGD72249.1 hypothetical protein PTSG_11569 [Salpingoeca rosetta]|eukprot:XP_004998820.1 hypothetical protein PTSG_11569 [Salpingoeca rosetta]
MRTQATTTQAAAAAVLLLLLAVLHGTSAQMFIYCGDDNCYDILGVDRTASQSEISKAYRRQARVLHPDRNKAEDAAEQFHKVANAYEVLKDADMRKEYDYFLEHPDEYYANIYRYYKRRAAPKVDVMPVIITFISVISAFQYFNQWRYHATMKDLATQNEHLRRKAKRVVLDDGRWKQAKSKADKEALVSAAVLEMVDLRGDYGPPSIQSLLACRIVMLPYTIAQYVAWVVSWHYRLTFKREEPTEEDKEYLIRRNLGLSQGKYEYLCESNPGFRAEVWAQHCWDAAKAKKYQQNQEMEERRRLLKSTKYKQYKRWLKANPEFE